MSGPSAMPAAAGSVATDPAPRLWIVLPVHNRIETTRKLVACLAEQTFSAFTLLVVDDGSSDGTADEVCGALPGVEVLRGDGNLWWAGALERAYQHLRKVARDDDVALILNNDVVFGAGFLQAGWNRMQGADRELVLAACHEQGTGAALTQGQRADWKALRFPPVEPGEEIGVLSTRGLFLKVGDWWEIGGFHPRLLPHYLSDYEFTIRAHRKGFRLACDPAIKLYADRSTSGIRGVAAGPFKELRQSLFDKRYVMSLRHWVPFVLLAAEPRYKGPGLLKVLRRFAGRVAGSFSQGRRRGKAGGTP